MQRIALIEDDAIVRQATSQWLQLAGFDVTAFEVGQDALSAVMQGDFHTIISDVRLPDIDGVELLGRFKSLVPEVPVILITGHGDVDMAVKALHQGAYDFIEKPFDPERLSQTVSEAVEKYQSSQDRVNRQSYLNNLKGIEQVLIGRSKVMCELREQIQKVASIDTNVIIYGETGCGKELVASCLHEFSERKRHPFVPLNCGAIPDNLFESELFGHEKGAFTGAITARKGRFELAEGGTLFLDEIGDMPMAMQVKLLRELQERCFERVGGNCTIQANVRVIAATHRNLEDMIDDDSFREDLYYRLNVFPIEMPALQERKEDIPLLIQELMTRMEAEGSLPICFTPRAINSLMEHDWPGNVRELANLVERMVILYPNSLVDVNHLPTKYRYSDIPEFQPEFNSFVYEEEQERDALADLFSEDFSFDQQDDMTDNANAPQELPPEGVNLKELLADMEVNMINQALEAQGGIVARAADMLGMRRTTLVEKMRKYNLQR